MHLQIKQRLFILIAISLLALAGIGIFSYYQASRLNDALTDAISRHESVVETVDKARGAQVRFKT